MVLFGFDVFSVGQINNTIFTFIFHRIYITINFFNCYRLLFFDSRQNNTSNWVTSKQNIYQSKVRVVIFDWIKIHIWNFILTQFLWFLLSSYFIFRGSKQFYTYNRVTLKEQKYQAKLRGEHQNIRRFTIRFP